jgi:hypothetical protein
MLNFVFDTNAVVGGSGKNILKYVNSHIINHDERDTFDTE